MATQFGQDQQKEFQVILIHQHYLNDAVKLLNHTFCTQNPIWKAYVKSQQQTFAYMYDLASTSMRTHKLYGLIGKKDQKLRCVVSFMDMVDYLDLLKSMKGKYDHIKLMSELSIYGQQLQKQMRSASYERGTTLNGLLGSIDSRYADSGYAKFLLSIAVVDLRDRGYQTTYSRSTNQRSRHGMQMMGGKVIKQINIKDTELKFYLLQIPHQRFEMTEQKKQFWFKTGFKAKL